MHIQDRATVPQASLGNQFSTFESMVCAKRWLLASPDKVPHYISGVRRQGEPDAPEDRAQLAPYHHAADALLQCGEGWLLGFALGPDGRGGHWQGIDLDDVVENRLADLANDAPGYVEMSPSGTGAHAIGYGRPFSTLGHNGTGVEAYAGGRYFTVTQRKIRDSTPACLANYVEQTLTPRHGVRRSISNNHNVELIQVDDRTKRDLRSAFQAMRSDDYHLWIRMGMAVSELGDLGRGLWMEWSSASDKFNAKQSARKWDSFNPSNTGYQAVFAEAQRHGWLNPASNSSQPGSPASVLDPNSTNPTSIKLEFAKSSDTATLKLDYLVDPYLPSTCAVGFFGRGATAKSSFLASMAAGISTLASTLWVSVEEPKDWIKVRHIRSGGTDGTLSVVVAVPGKKDTQGRVITSSFDIYEHLGPAILQAKAASQLHGKPPLRLVVLDTAVGLTAWARGESPNDDVAVKRLLAYLQNLAETHFLTIAMIGHANKGKHEHFADTVMGASAWTNSPRLSFIHARDRREEHSYVVRVAKSSVDQSFAASYVTVPVHTLHERPNGANSVLCRVERNEEIWGADASMELFEAATRNPDADDGDEGKRKTSLVDKVLTAVVEMVHTLGGPVTREMAHTRLGREVSRREWSKVEDRLRLAQFQYKVGITPGPQNLAIYQKLT
ncbi:MAG: PriCT-2 domain-containing protein [Micropepsaceae bacterium]